MFKLLVKLIPTRLRRTLSRMLKYGLVSRLFFLLSDLDDTLTRVVKGRKEFYSFQFEGKTLVGNIRFSKGTLDEGIYHLIRRILGNAPLDESCVLLDVGANIGLTSIVMAEFAKPANAKIFSFEPGDQIKFLRKNVLTTDNKNCIFPQEIALADQDGEMTLFTYHESIVDSRLYLDETWQGRKPERILRKKVPTRTLDSFCEEHNISPDQIRLIKLDCQGAEPYILKGMFGNKPLPTNLSVIMEFWPYSILQQGDDPKAFLRLVHERFNGSQFYFFKDESELIPISSKKELLDLEQVVGVGENLFCDLVIVPSEMILDFNTSLVGGPQSYQATPGGSE